MFTLHYQCEKYVVREQRWKNADTMPVFLIFDEKEIKGFNETVKETVIITYYYTGISVYSFNLK